MAEDRLAAVARLREAHLQAPFPRRLYGEDVAGVEMVMLDSDVAGCVSTVAGTETVRTSCPTMPTTPMPFTNVDVSGGVGRGSGRRVAATPGTGR